MQIELIVNSVFLELNLSKASLMTKKISKSRFD